MAVTLTTVSLVQPIGQLEATFFPGGNMDDLLTGWLTNAIGKVEANPAIRAELHNDAAEQWAYHLAYSYIAGRFAAMPSSASVNDGADSVSYGQDRITYWSSRAAAALAAYLGFISGKTTPKASYTGPVPVRAVW